MYSPSEFNLIHFMCNDPHSFNRNVKMTNAQNGARIKAWAGQNVGSGIVKNVTFQNFFETTVDNPVVIDQVKFIVSNSCVCLLRRYISHSIVLYDKLLRLRKIPVKYFNSGYLVHQVSPLNFMNVCAKTKR